MTALTNRARSLRKSQTEAERKLWKHLRNRQLDGYKFYRQYPIHPYYVDFVCRTADLIVELDGGQHNQDDIIVYDERRTAFLESKGYTVLRFWNNDVLNNIEGVIEMIGLSLTHSANAATRQSSIALSLKGEGMREKLLSLQGEDTRPGHGVSVAAIGEGQGEERERLP